MLRMVLYIIIVLYICFCYILLTLRLITFVFDQFYVFYSFENILKRGVHENAAGVHDKQKVLNLVLKRQVPTKECVVIYIN